MIIFLSYIFYFITSSLSPLQTRWLLKKKDATGKEQISFAFQIMLIIFLGGLFLPLFSPFYFSGNPYYLLLLTLVCGLFGAGVFIAKYIAQKHVEAGITSVVSNIYTPITIILASLFLHEGLTLSQIGGTALLLMAMIMVSKKHRTGKFTFDKYFLLMLLSGILLGVLLVAERALQKTTGFSAGTMLSWGSQCFFLGIITLAVKSKHSYTEKEVLVSGVLRFLQALSYVILVWVVGNLSVVSAVTTFNVVVIFIAAAIFLKEREDLPQKILGSIVAVVGLLLMK